MRRLGLLMLMFATPAFAQPADKIDFRRDVVPILESRCFECHKGSDASASYRLDLRAELLGETTGKPLVKPGKSNESRLIHVVQGKIPNRLMPRKGLRLTPQEIDILRAWIDQGLTWDDKLFPATQKSDHWAFQPIKPPPIPNVKNKAWIATPVDAFVATKHVEYGLTPTKVAGARTLLRRLSLDLTGLPPALEDMDAFDKAWTSTNSVLSTQYSILEKHVDRLLASPHYGERSARAWLDVARWAESEGYESNHLRLHAWRYRDWVVNAFHRDLSFKDFIRQQLAGDELTPYADDHLIATGFLASARLSSNEEDRPRQRNDIHVDIVNTTASAFLGLTMQCAQCHNHKFDPITARDYYRFMGYFVKGQPGNLALRNPKLWDEYNAKKVKGYDEALKERDALFALAQERRFEETRKSLSQAQKDAIALTREERTPAQDKLARETDLLFQFTMAQFERMLSADEKNRYDAVKKSVADMEKSMLEKPQTFGYFAPSTSPHAIDVLPMKGFYPLPFEPKELARAKAFLYEAGDVHRPAFAVDTGMPAFLSSPHAPREERATRLALADWLASPQNPLTARVYVNRIWQQHFGSGLVATPGDFGVKGAMPTHPELLDYLASELLRTGSTKHIHRLIVLSNTYRQASTADTANAKRDPDNQYLWRWTPRRLEAEAIRDSILTASVELDRQVGGPSDPADEKSVRRSIYVFQKREAPPKMQALFDGPFGMTESCARRQTTTVALQPLYLLNSNFSVARSKALAERVAKSAGHERDRQIEMTYRYTLGRTPDAQEMALGRRFFERLASQPDAALAHYCQAIMNLNEFVYLE